MRLFAKVFLLLLFTLLITAGISNWLGEKWRTENQLIETRLARIAALGETAVNIYEEEGTESYLRWMRHNLRRQQAFGVLTMADGSPINRPDRFAERPRPLPEHLHQLIDQARSTLQSATMIEPPRVGIAIPIEGKHGRFIWAATSLLSPEEMRQSGSSMRMLQLMIALLTLAAVSMLLTRMLTRPIRSLQSTSERLGHGDLTARVDAKVTARNDELGDLAITMNQMAGKLDGLVESHKQLLRDISHELRSPLARLQVALELARNAAGDLAVNELDRIGKEADELNMLIGEVLTLARFEQGAMSLNSESLQLDELLDEIIGDADFEANAVGKSVNWQKPSAITIQADPLWLARAFDNVIRNAIRYTQDASSVDIFTSMNGQQVVISVRDHGPGVPENALSSLFEPFFRVSTARERPGNHTGYGLGLAIARYAIEQHGGSINATNHPDGGLIIIITLPLI